MIEIKDDNFEQIIQSGNPLIIDCFADWCSPCKALKPLLSELATTNGIELGLVNIEFNQKIAERFKISSIPLVLFFNNGEQLRSVTGMRSKDFYQNIITELFSA